MFLVYSLAYLLVLVAIGGCAGLPRPAWAPDWAAALAYYAGGALLLVGLWWWLLPFFPGAEDALRRFAEQVAGYGLGPLALRLAVLVVLLGVGARLAGLLTPSLAVGGGIALAALACGPWKRAGAPEPPRGRVVENVEPFRWTYIPAPDQPGYPMTATLEIALDRVREFRSHARLPDVRQWGHYVAEGGCPEVDDMAAQLKHLAWQHNFASFDEAGNVLAFAQGAIPYALDRDSVGREEYPRYPLETLADREGDCEDTSILAASLLRTMGYGVRLLLYPGHMALGVAGCEGLPGQFVTIGGQRYYYAETTEKGWKLGEVPEALQNVAPEVLV